MHEKITSSQNKLAKECIFTALMILMEKKRFNEISITEITKKAGVSRMAYYRNYNFKEDIIVKYLDELFGEYLNELLAHKMNTRYQNAYMFFTYFRKHEKLINNLIKSNLTHLILERFDKYLYELFGNIINSKTFSPEEEKYMIEYTSGGLYKILLTWVKNGLKESDKEMAKIIINLSK